MKIENTGGKIWYGLHFYPGVAEYQDESDGNAYRVFLNENTLRSMDPTFAGKPVFVEHVDEVDPNLKELRKEAEGWVIESFFNTSDGKHWVKFITITPEAENAIKNGWRLSNAYIPQQYMSGGLWNGVSYEKEITNAQYEHLAIVNNPRYEESIILSPDDFKKYNEDCLSELKKISNSKKGAPSNMKFNFFKRSSVEQKIDPSTFVTLPKSGKSVSLESILNEADEKMKDKKNKEEMMGKMKDTSGSSDDDSSGESAKHHVMADLDHMIKMHDGSYMKIKDMMNKHKSMMDEMEKMKKDSTGKELDLQVEPEDVDVEGDLHNVDSEHDLDEHEEEVEQEEHKMEMKDDLGHPEDVVHDDEDDEEAKKKALELAEHEEKEIEEAKKKNLKKKNAKEKSDRLRNAHLRVQNAQDSAPVLELSQDRVQRGIQRYGR